jgi:AraC-like DNA-binding protein
MPAAMRGGERRVWLEKNVGVPNPAAPAETRRIQAIIDEHLGRAAHFRLDDLSAQLHSDTLQDSAAECFVEEEVSLRGLANVVADEKAGNIRQQRPAIQGLGRATLRRLIHKIFEHLSDDRYEEREIANAFGLSAPTFSRFAGHRWRLAAQARPPDLWANTARLIAGHKVFVEVAQEAGVWPRVQELASGCGMSALNGATP